MYSGRERGPKDRSTRVLVRWMEVRRIASDVGVYQEPGDQFRDQRFVCFVLVLLGWSVFTDFLGGYLALPSWLVDIISNFSFKSHFNGSVKGIVDPKDVVFFLSLAGFCLSLNVLVLDR